MAAKITTHQPSHQEQVQVLQNISDKLLELQTLEIQLDTTKDLTTRVAEFARLLKKQAQPLIDLERASKAVAKAQKDFEVCHACYKRMWTKMNGLIDPIASDLQQTIAGFIRDPKTPALPLEQILQKIENMRTAVSFYLETGATSTDLVKAIELLDNYEAGLFDKSQNEQMKAPVKKQPIATLKDEVRPPIPQKVEQLIEVQPELDDLDWMLDGAAELEGMGYEQIKLPTPSASTAPSSSTTTTTTSATALKTDTVRVPEKELSTTRRNTNPLAGEQICMQFICEFARFYRDPRQLNLDSIIQLGIETYNTDKNNFPERLHCLTKDNESPACVFEPKFDSYLKLLNDLEGNCKGFKGGVIPLIGAVLQCGGRSIAIVIVQLNKQPQFHIFCPDGSVKFQEKTDAFRIEFATVKDAAGYLAELHKSMKATPLAGTMHAFIRKQDFLINNKMIKNGSASSSTSSSSTSVSTSPTSIPVLKPSITIPAHWHHEQTLKEVQSRAFSEKPADLLAAFAQLKELKAKAGKDQTSIAALALGHLYFVQRLQKDKNINLPNYSMVNSFQNLEGFSSTPEQRYAALNHARADVLLDGLEAAYKANDFLAAQRYLLSISTLCQQSSEGPVKESFSVLEAMSTWDSPAKPQEILSRIAFINGVRTLLQQAWGMTK